MDESLSLGIKIIPVGYSLKEGCFVPGSFGGTFKAGNGVFSRSIFVSQCSTLSEILYTFLLFKLAPIRRPVGGRRPVKVVVIVRARYRKE